MINKFKALDSIGLISYLHKLVLAIRQFFATKTEMDVVATALTDLDNRKIEVSDIPASLPANGGNADYATSATTASKLGTANVGSGTQHFYLNTGTATASTSTVGGTAKPIYLKVGVMTAISDTIGSTSLPVYLDAGTITTCTAASVFSNLSNSGNDISVTVAGQNRTLTVAYAESAGDAGTLGGWHKSAFATANHTHTISEITNFPTIGNGALHLKVNGTELTPEGGIFTANKGGDSTIDLTESLATRPEINTLGGRVDKIDTSIAGLTAATQIENKFDDSTEGNEEIIESNDEPYKDELGRIKLRFWNIANTIYDLPVYDVFVLPLATVKESFGNLSYYCEIFFIIGITDDSLVNSVGFTSGEYKSFFIRGANVKNKVCGFDVRGSGNVNSANACVTGGYLHLYCYLKLSGDSGTGNDIMEIAKNGKFEAYFCLRQTP